MDNHHSGPPSPGTAATLGRRNVHEDHPHIKQMRALFPAEVDEHATEIVGVLLDAVVEQFDLLAVEES